MSLYLITRLLLSEAPFLCCFYVGTMRGIFGRFKAKWNEMHGSVQVKIFFIPSTFQRQKIKNQNNNFGNSFVSFRNVVFFNLIEKEIKN